MLYVICDGHSGSKAANFVAENMERVLSQRLLMTCGSKCLGEEFQLSTEGNMCMA